MNTKQLALIPLLLILFLVSCAPPTGGPPPPRQQAGEQPAAQQPAETAERGAETEAPLPPPVVNDAAAQPADDNSAEQAQPISNNNNQTIATTGCAADDFLTVQADPQNSEYATPQLTARCTGTEVIVQSNGIPNFEFVPTTPNQLTTQNFTFTFPQNPVEAAEPSAVPLGGATAVAVNGLPIFGPTEAPQAGYRDPYLDGILDYCNGHTAPGGVYHYHARPDCLYENSEGQVGLVVAYSFDGYPVLAPYICADASCETVTKIESSWELTNPSIDNAWEQHSYVPGLSQLDECNGMTLADGSYAYFATDTFPYFMGCYHGQPTTNRLGR